MKSHETLGLILLYNILETAYLVVKAEDGRTQAFFHVEGDLHYLIDGVTMEMQEFYRTEEASSISFSDLSGENLNAYEIPIVFHPPMLNFHSHPVGVPSMEHIIVYNLSPDTSIHMLSISGNTLHTHCSFFHEKIIPPGGNTSFDVVLLAREEGPIEDTLFIHTSLGSFKFQVSAIGISNPFRLRPFIGVRMPLNSSYTPIIHLHNPLGTTLQLLEMYSSGGNLHLELLDGGTASPKKLWEIPPYQTKPIIKVKFIARVEKNHTAFIRIKMNSSHHDYLLIPLEIDVTSTPGIYSTSEELHFGVLRSQDEPRTLTLSLLNSGQKHIHITNVISTPANEAIDIKFITLKIPPDTVFSTQVATVTFYPSKALHPRQCCGKIVIKSKNNQFKLQIPYQAQLLQGTLVCNENATSFFVGLKNDSQVKEISVTNNFSVSIIVYNVSLPKEVDEHFSLSLKTPVILQVGKSAIVGSLTYKSTIPDLQLTSFLRLHTNISHFDFPLMCFTGRLKVFLLHALNASYIDFGMLGIEEKRTAAFAVINENPVDVNLKYWGSNRSKTYVELVGVEKGNVNTFVWKQNYSSKVQSLILNPRHYAIFYISITAPKHEGIFKGLAFVETQFEIIHIPFSFRTAKGSLKVDEITFENSFPGKISTQNVYIYSTFSRSMTITGISTVPEDSRFNFLKYGTPVLHPNSKTMVGKILFDHRKNCKQKCYSGLPTTTTMGLQWLLGMPLSSDVGNTDGELFHTLYKRWRSLIELNENSINVTLRIDTTEVRGYLLNARATLQWPQMLSLYNIRFPITQIGNHSVKDFTLENPSSLPVLVQIVPLSLYPSPANIISILKKLYGDEYFANNLLEDSKVFSLQDLETINLNPKNHIVAYRKSLEEFFGIQSHKKSIAMLLTPSMRVCIHVGFTPHDDSWKSSLILIRNNLTVIDAVLIQGQGGYGKIKLGNVPPGSDSILTFELTEKLLKACDNSNSLKSVVPNFTIKRAFTAKNTGALPLYVKFFDINGKFCQGFGFRILNCQPFELKPNASKKIDMVYMPDFSSTYVENFLSIHTSQGHERQTLQYKIVATAPRHVLEFCFKAVPRPSWEPYVYYIFASLSLILLIAVVVCGYFDSKHILHNTFFPMITIEDHDKKLEQKSIFDLNAICANIDESQRYLNDTVSDKNESFIENFNLSDSDALSFTKNLDTPTHKKKSINIKNLEESPTDRYLKKRISKKHILENCCSELTEVEFKKTQSKNSWTRFLKPPFSFQSCSNMNNKPSVATQTIGNSIQEDTTKSFKELGIASHQNINYFINIDNDVTCKKKNQIDCNYEDSNDRIKKGNDSQRDEETSSTTTESDLSEKDNHFTFVRDNYLSQKTWCSRSKDSSSKCTSAQFPKSPNGIYAKQFELNTKKKIHKKMKDSARKFGREIRQPSALELPYKSFLPAVRNEDLDFSCRDTLCLNQPHYALENFKTLTSEQPQDFVLHEEIHNYLWMEPESSSYFDSTFISDPPSYSAAVSKDTFKNKTKIEVGNNNIDNSKLYKDWPGFDLKSIRESYWDTNYNPSHGSWTDKTESLDITPNTSESLWNNSLVSIWESEPVAISSTTYDNCSSVDKVTRDKNVASNPIVKNKEMSVEFKPFHTSSALWIPQSNKINENDDSGFEKSAWSFSLFSDAPQMLPPESSQESKREK